MKLEKNQIKKILIISLSNIGDIVLTFPVIDILKRDFPDASIDVVVGPKGESLIKGNPIFRKVYLYEKGRSPFAILKWIGELAAEHYDLTVDLRNTAIPFLIFAKYKTPLMLVRPKGLHMRQQHLARLRTVHNYTQESAQSFSLFISDADKKAVEQLLSFHDSQFTFHRSRLIVIAPGSRAENKRWREDGFAKLADHLNEHHNLILIFVGDENDVPVTARIKSLMKTQPLDLTGKLNLPQLAHLISLSRSVFVNDSAPMHLASYLNIPVAAFFGPTDPKKYGPWSKKHIVLQNNSQSPACADDQAKPHDCMQALTFESAIKVLVPWFKEIFDGQ